jgi:hypothetical protein
MAKVAGAADFKAYGASLERGVSGIVKTFGISQQSVTRLTADVVTMGYSIRGATSEAYKLSEAIAFTATLGDIGLNTSRDFFRTMLKVFTQGEPGIKTFNDQLLATNFIVDQLNQIENKTVINLNQLAEAMPKAAGAAKLFGLNAAQLASILTGVYDKGIQLDTAATGINFILTRILNPTKQAAERFDAAFGAGTLSSVQQLGGGMEKLIRIAELYQQMSNKGAKEGKDNYTEIGQVFGELVQRRQIKTFVPMVQSVITGTAQIKDAIKSIPGLESTLKADGVDLATAKLDDLKSVMGEYRKELLQSQYLTEGFGRAIVASSAYTELSKEKLKDLADQYRKLSAAEIEVRLRSPETQFRILTETIKMTGASIGKALVPAFLKVMHAISSFFEKIASMSTQFKAVFASVAVGLALLGPGLYLVSSLGTVFGLLTRTIFSLVPGLKFLTVEQMNLLAANGALEGNVMALGNRYIWLRSQTELYANTEARTVTATDNLMIALRDKAATEMQAEQATKLLAEAEALATKAAQDRAGLIASAIKVETEERKYSSLETRLENAKTAESDNMLTAQTIANSEKRKVARLDEANQRAFDRRVTRIDKSKTGLSDIEAKIQKEITAQKQLQSQLNTINSNFQSEMNSLTARQAAKEKEISAQRSAMAAAVAEKELAADEMVAKARQIKDEQTLIRRREAHLEYLAHRKREMESDLEFSLIREESGVRYRKDGGMYKQDADRLKARQAAAAMRQEEINEAYNLEVQKTNAAIRGSENRIAVNENEYTAIENRMRGHEAHIANRNSNIAALEAELQTIKDEVVAAESERNAALKTLNDEQAASEKKLTSLQEKEVQKRKALAELENEHNIQSAAEYQAAQDRRALAVERAQRAADRATAAEQKRIAVEAELSAQQQALDAARVAYSDAAATVNDNETRSLYMQAAALAGLTEAEAAELLNQSGLVSSTAKLTGSIELNTEARQAQIAAIFEQIAALHGLSAAEAEALASQLLPVNGPPVPMVPPVLPRGGLKTGFKTLGRGALKGVKGLGRLLTGGLLGGGGAGAAGAEAGAAAGATGAGGGVLSGIQTLGGPLLIIAAAVAAITGAVILLIKHWKDVSEGMKGGLKYLSKAWGELKKAFSSVVDIFKSSTKAIGGQAEQGREVGNVWNSIGKIFSGVIQVVGLLVRAFAGLINILKPVFQYLSDILGSTIGSIVSFIQVISALFQGDWKSLWSYLWRTVLYATKLVIKTLDFGLLGSISRSVQVVGRFFSWLGLGVGKSLQKFDISKSINKKLDDAIKGSEGKRKITYTLEGLSKNDRQSRAALTQPKENLATDLFGDKTGAGSGGAASKAADAFNSFLQKLKEKLDNFINKLKDQISQEIDSVWSKRLQVYDDQIKAIDLLEKKEEELLATQQYIESRREAMQKRSLDRENYRRNRSLAIYEGRIDDARMMDLEFSQTDKSNTKGIADIEQSRARELLKKTRDLQRERINTEKDAAEARKAIEEKALKDQIDLITKYTPKTEAEWRLMMDQINNTLANYGIPTITGTWQNGLAIFQQSIAEIAADVKDDNFWNGSWVDASMRGWLEIIGGQNYKDAIYELGRQQGQSMGDGFTAGAGGAGGGAGGGGGGPTGTGDEGPASAAEVADATAQAGRSRGGERGRGGRGGNLTWKQSVSIFRQMIRDLAASDYSEEKWKELLSGDNGKKFKTFLVKNKIFPYYQKLVQKRKIQVANWFTAAAAKGQGEDTLLGSPQALMQSMTPATPQQQLQRNQLITAAQMQQAARKRNQFLMNHGNIFGKHAVLLGKRDKELRAQWLAWKKAYGGTKDQFIDSLLFGPTETGQAGPPSTSLTPREPAGPPIPSGFKPPKSSDTVRSRTQRSIRRFERNTAYNLVSLKGRKEYPGAGEPDDDIPDYRQFTNTGQKLFYLLGSGRLVLKKPSVLRAKAARPAGPRGPVAAITGPLGPTGPIRPIRPTGGRNRPTPTATTTPGQFLTQEQRLGIKRILGAIIPGDDVYDGTTPDGTKWYLLKNGKWSKTPPGKGSRGGRGRGGRGTGRRERDDIREPNSRDIIRALENPQSLRGSSTAGVRHGKNFTTGMSKGLTDNINILKNPLLSLTNYMDTTTASPAGLDSRSPSRKAKKFGKFWAQGIAEGLTSPDASAALRAAINALISPFLDLTRRGKLKINFSVETGGIESGLKEKLDEILNKNMNFRTPQWLKELENIFKIMVSGARSFVKMKDIQSGIAPDKVGPSQRALEDYLRLNVPGFATGGIVKRRSGGILAQIGEGRYDEAVIPLPNGLRGFANGFQPSRVSMASFEGNIQSAMTAALKECAPYMQPQEAGGVNIYVDNFIGQPQWFESMMSEYGVKVAPNKQRSYGTMNRRVSSYQDNNYRTGRI